MNEGLLGEALAARDRFLEAQHRTDSARADYHHAIRRLHASGESTREIARQLGLSHQRVHQIVDAAEPPAATAKKPSRRRRLAGEQDGSVASADLPRRRVLGNGIRLTGDAQQVLLRAEDEARSLNHHYLGTEHILLGLLAAADSVAARILTRAGADHEEARAAIERIINRGPHEPPPGPVPLTPRAKKALNRARKEAKSEHSTHTRAEHLLSGILKERNGVATQVLTALGVDHADVRRRIACAGRVCSFCARDGIDVAKLIAGPRVFICDRCTREAAGLTTDPAAESAHPALTAVPAHHQDASCSFCGKQRTKVDHLIAGPGAAICPECLTLCREINHEQGISPTD